MLMERMSAFPGHSESSRNLAFRLGVILGVCFSGVGLTWLLLANRVPYLGQYAFERNLSLAIAFIVLGLVPTSRFMKSPRRSFLCGITAWAIFTATYSAMELHFPGLATRLSAFHLFVLGGVVLGLLAALSWVMNLVIVLRRVRISHLSPGQAR
jgi:hypothetical protein